MKGVTQPIDTHSVANLRCDEDGELAFQVWFHPPPPVSTKRVVF